MLKLTTVCLLISATVGCTANNSSDSITSQPARKIMPDINQQISPTQWRAMMSGDQPDWNEIAAPRFDNSSK
ncbi:hypothetical protein ACFFJN_05590 [Erwinia mallotivora]|uniref:hypothetical protein n=1 Tax=Erwinia mallotivora TaxID=69222 RepID=UPI0035EA186E